MFCYYINNIYVYIVRPICLLHVETHRTLALENLKYSLNMYCMMLFLHRGTRIYLGECLPLALIHALVQNRRQLENEKKEAVSIQCRVCIG